MSVQLLSIQLYKLRHMLINHRHASNHSNSSLVQFIDCANYYLAPKLGVTILYRHIQALCILWCIHVVYRMLLRSPLRRCYKYARLLLQPAAVRRRYAELERIMYTAKTYDTWAAAATELDKLDNVWSYKDTSESNIYDYKRIQFELQNFQQLIQRCDIAGIMSYARARLMRNLVNINDRRLHIVLRAGTKRLIEQYICTVVSALQLVCTVECDTVTSADKLAFFNETRHAFGRSALLLSGGATMALFHTGVVKALFQNNLLPRVISGSSGGAIICSMLGTRTDSELATMLDPSTNAVNFNFFPTNKGTAFRRIQRFWSKGVVLDINILAACVNANVSQLTFAEAYAKTGRIINISISPAARSGNQESSRICNYLTTPNLLVSSACLASCAIPGIYAPVELLCKNAKGEIEPYLESYNSGEKVVWEDGSVMSDLPMTRLSELFNVNNYIVSQVNPHIAPFVSAAFNIGRNVDTLLTNPVSKLIQFLALQLKDTALNLNRLGILPLHPSARFVLEQQYMGDVTITPNLTIKDFQLLLVNPTVERYAHCQRQTELQTFAKLSTIRGLMEIELCLDECVRRMRGILILEELTQQKALHAMSKTMSWSADAFESYYESDSDAEHNNSARSTAVNGSPIASIRTPTQLNTIREISNDNLDRVPAQSITAADSTESVPALVRRTSASATDYINAMHSNDKQLLGSNPRLSQLVTALPQIDMLRTASQPTQQQQQQQQQTTASHLVSRATSLQEPQCDYFQSVRMPSVVLPIDTIHNERVSPHAQPQYSKRNTRSMLQLNDSQYDNIPQAKRSVSHQPSSEHAQRQASPQSYNGVSLQRRQSLKFLMSAARRPSTKQDSQNVAQTQSPISGTYSNEYTHSPSSYISPKLMRAISDNTELQDELKRVTSLPHAVSQLELASDCNAAP